MSDVPRGKLEVPHFAKIFQPVWLSAKLFVLPEHTTAL